VTVVDVISSPQCYSSVILESLQKNPIPIKLLTPLMVLPILRVSAPRVQIFSCPLELNSTVIATLATLMLKPFCLFLHLSQCFTLLKQVNSIVTIVVCSQLVLPT
jgi:hypothetical protein